MVSTVLINSYAHTSDPSNWTLVNEWDTREGDLSTIDAAFTLNSNDGFAWSPDGTKLTICNAADDIIRTFSCSTPFDPETASTLSSRSETNPQGIQFVLDGNAHLQRIVVGDEFTRSPSSSYQVGGGAEHSDITKADVGFTGNQDGFIVPHPDLDYLLWFGETGTETEIKYITLISGSLNSYTVQATQGIDPPLSAVGLMVSALNKNQESFYMVGNSPGVRLVTMPSAHDIANISFGTVEDLATQFSPASNWAVNNIWTDPEDTRYVWIGGDTYPGIQLAKFETNV